LWFLGFLFSFSILCLPVFLWLKGETGRRFIARLEGMCRYRGALLMFVIPLAVIRLVLHPFFPEEHSWADFLVQMSFFLLGFLLFSGDGLLHAVRRDWRIHLGVGVLAFAVGVPILLSKSDLNLELPPRTILDFLFWTMIAIAGWCWSLFTLYVGMRYLNFANRTLEYGQDAIVPFFVFHQPVIMILAYFAVQWQASLVIKLLFVVIGSFLVTLGIYEFGVRRVPLLRKVFGMKIVPARELERQAV
jgi:hypothetical protein